MVEFIKNWAAGIIVAVIIGTILEMVLPENKNKKYIKTVIGIYILFTIISPIVSSALTEGTLNVSKYENYLTSSNEYNDLSANFEIDTTNNIQKIYQEQIEEDIKTKLKAKGYQVENMEVEIVTEEGEEYGKIKTITLTVSVSEIKQEENAITNEIEIQKIEVGNAIDQSQNSIATSNITEKQKREIKSYLSEEYGIKKEKIIIS